MIVALIACVPAVSQAAQPEFYSYQGEDIGTYEALDISEACGFPVLLTNYGTAKGRITEDKQGNVRVVETYSHQFRHTFTNANTGATLTTTAPAKFEFDYYVDGSITLTVTGLQENVTVRGQGSIFRDAGKIVFSLTEPGKILFEAGTHDSFNLAILGQQERAERLCAALAA